MIKIMGSSKEQNYFIHEDDLEPSSVVKNEPIYEVYSQEAEEAYYDSNSNDSNADNMSNNKNQITFVKNEIKTYNNYDDDGGDSEEDDDIKMINATQLLMNQIDENLSKISYIDLTQDDDDDDDCSNKTKNKPQNDYVSPIVISEKSSSFDNNSNLKNTNIAVDSPILVRSKQSDPSSSKIKQQTIDEPVCISLIDDDENSSEFINNAMMQFCDQKEKEYNHKMEIIKNNDETIMQMEVENNNYNQVKNDNEDDDDDDIIDFSKLKEIETEIYKNCKRIIKSVNEPVETLTPSNQVKAENEENNRGKKVLLNLKRMREIVSSEEESDSSNKKKSSSDAATPKRPTKRLSSSDESDVAAVKSNETPNRKSDYFKQLSNKNSTKPPPHPISSPSITHEPKTARASSDSMTPQKSVERLQSIDRANSKSATGENLGCKRTILIQTPPESMKIRKKSINQTINSMPAKTNETGNSLQNKLKSQTSAEASSSSTTKSSDLIDLSAEPDLNSVDMAKKEAIEKLNKNFLLAPPQKKQLPKAYEQMKSLKCKESGALKKYMDNNNKKSNASGPIGLTQTMNLAKIENLRRLQSIMNDKSNQPKEDTTSKNLSIKNIPKTIPVVEESSSSSIVLSKPQPQPQPQAKSTEPSSKPLIKPIFLSKNVKENDKNICNTSSNNNNNNINKQPQENKSSSDIDKTSKNKNQLATNNENDLVGNIIHSMNKQNIHQTSNQNQKSNKDTVYKFEHFIYRIVKFNYDWLKEQEKCSGPPPVVTDEERKRLGPIVESYLSFKDYFTTMFPLLLSETWHEITRPWREMYHKKERKTYQSMPLWFIQTSENKELSVFTCQIIIDSTVKQSHIPSEDDLLHFTIMVKENGDRKRCLEMFGVVFKVCRLRREDDRIINVVKEYLREQEQKRPISDKNYSSSQSPINSSKIVSKNFIIYELQVYVRTRNYQINHSDKLEYDLITSLSSIFRRSRALITFQHSPLKDHILNGSSDSPIFWPDKNNIKKCGEVDFKFDKLKDYNESQRIVIMEASSLILANTPKFYFIQGPPGTGKSHTIIGIVHAMIARHKIYNSYAEKSKKCSPLPNLKILVCSPSNGGCDELTRRFKSFKNKLRHEKIRELNVVRVGRIESMHRDCDEITLDNLSRKKFEELVTKKNCEKSNSLNEHYKQLTLREETMRKKLKILKSSASNNEPTIKELESQLDEVVKRKKDFESKLKKSSNFSEMTGSDRKKLEIESKEMVLKEADVIICTLNFSGNQLLDCLTAERNNGRPLVSIVIIDEAAQCLELESLIPLRFGCNKFIQVGDPEQLPATVLSKLAQDCNLGQSLFERIYQKFRFENNNPIKMLYLQYRMHSEICLFPSNNFYRGKLKTNEEANRQRSSFHIEPYLVFNIEESQEICESEKDEVNGSIYNPIEAETILEFCKILMKKNLKLNSESIGIITPYQRQVQHLRDLFSKNNLERIEIGTVDGYQGREKDIILFSTVRAKGNSIGFLTNRQRLNVSLTRAKYALYIFCHAKSLMVNEDWRNCIQDAESRQLFINNFSIIDK